MVVLITGASHTGKTLLAQKILERHHFPYLSIDHLKMGLIRSGYTDLTPEDDRELTAYLWPVVREMIKTAVENRQNLVVEGGYIPFGWETDFPEEYRKDIRYCCLVMSRPYIERHFSDILAHACAIEQRREDSFCTKAFLLRENAYYRAMCEKYGYPMIWIDKEYAVEENIAEYGKFTSDPGDGAAPAPGDGTAGPGGSFGNAAESPCDVRL